jgi:cyanate lyase
MKRSEAETAAVAAVAAPKPMTREDVTDLIYSSWCRRGIKWVDVAKKVGQSKEWVTAACLGQMTLTREQRRRWGRSSGFPHPR